MGANLSVNYIEVIAMILFVTGFANLLLQKNLIKNNMTDKEDTPDLAFEKIVPLEIVATDDPSVIGIKKIPNLRGSVRKLNKKYESEIDFDEYVELEPTDNETAPRPDIEDVIEKP